MKDLNNKQTTKRVQSVGRKADSSMKERKEEFELQLVAMM